MKAYFRYQKGYLYEEHGAWYVRYRQRVPQEDGSSKLKHISKHLGRSKDFSNIFAVERCRASFMQTVNEDRLSRNSRITLTAFVEGLYLPWTKEERRASTSTGHRQIWIKHLRGRVGELRLREFRTVDASRMLRTVAKELGSHLHTGTAWGIAPTTLRWGLTDLGKFRGQRTQKIASISSAHLKWTVLSVGK
jgi:hypothetical protein